MTLLQMATAFTGDELLAACRALGVRRPLGLGHLADGPPRAPVAGATAATGDLPCDVVAALSALAAPEAIAIAERIAPSRARTTYIAVRGPWAGVHRIHGDCHVVEAIAAEDATTQLWRAVGLDTAESESWSTVFGKADDVVDVSCSAYARMVELAALNDLTRAAAALESEGVCADTAAALSRACRSEAVHVIGMRSTGVRFEGCELSWVGADRRWSVPLPARSQETAAVLGAHLAPRHLRVRVESADAAWLRAELALIFG